MSQFIEMFKDSHKVGLGQLATFINGSAFKPEDWSTEGLPIVRIQNLNDTSCEYNYYNGDCSKKIVIDNGDVLVSWSATLGVFIWDKGKALLNQHIFKVVFDKIEIDRDFFIYTVSVALDKMSQHTHGSTMKHIVKSEFNKFPVACPTLSEQKEFAQIAQQADKSEFDVIKSQFIEMFGRTENTKPLSDFIEVSFPGEWGQEDKDGNGVKVIRTTNFTNTGKLNLADVVTRDIDPNKVEKKKLKKGDIILERSGGTNDNPVGRVVYFNEDGLYLFNNFTQLLRCKEEVNSLFIFYSLFNYYQMNKRIIRSMGNKTTGIQNLKMDQYWQIPIADVPVERQNEFEAIYRQADKSESGCEYRMVS